VASHGARLAGVKLEAFRLRNRMHPALQDAVLVQQSAGPENTRSSA
jgi:hypothetical protein